MNNPYMNQDSNGSMDLRYKLRQIRSNIENIKEYSMDEIGNKELNSLCKSTIRLVSSAHKIVQSDEKLRNYKSLLDFLNYSSILCKNKISKKNRIKEKKILQKKKLKNDDLDNGSKDNLIKKLRQQMIKDDKSENSPDTKDEIRENKNDIKNIKSAIKDVSDKIITMEEKLNACMKSIAVSLELISYNVQKSNLIHEDLKCNNTLTNKICYLTNKSENNMICQNTGDQENNFSLFIKNLMNEIITTHQDDLLKIDKSDKNCNIELNLKNNKNLINYLIQAVLKNSKEMLCKIIPQMNLMQRQKIFTSILKIVENRIDDCSEKVSDLIQKKINKDDTDNINTSNPDTMNSLKEIFNLDNLTITKNDIARASWDEDTDDEDENEDVDEDEDQNQDQDKHIKRSNLQNNRSNIKNNLFKNNKNQILEEIIHILENENTLEKQEISDPEG